MRRNLIIATIFLLFIGGGIRAVSMYDRYKTSESEGAKLKLTMENNKEDVIKTIFQHGHTSAELIAKDVAHNLHEELLQEYTLDEVYNSIVKKYYNVEMLDVFDKVFDLNGVDANVVFTVGTQDDVIYSKSNTNFHKFKYIDTNGRKTVSWEEFYNNMNNPEVTKRAYLDLAMRKKDYVILRLDGDYVDNRYYTLDDVVKDYMKNGMKNMDQFCILTMGVITETGDMFGERDIEYMERNDNSNKIYVFQAISLDVFFRKDVSVISNIEKEYEESIQIFKYRAMSDMAQTLMILLIVLISIILLMVMLKDVSEEIDEIERLNKNKVEENKRLDDKSEEDSDTE